jgi:capsular polysaccharide biosynthesis protein
LILNQTAKDLDLTQLYTKQLNLDRPLTLDESSTLLHRHIRLNQPRGTDLIEIWVNDLDRQLAAATANHIVQTYQNQRAARGIQVTILDIAKPGLRPVSPNIFYNLAVGFLISLSLALFFGILAAAITRRLTRSHVATQS